MSNKKNPEIKSDFILNKIREKLKESDPNNRTVLGVFQWNFKDESGKLIKSVVMDLNNLQIYNGIVNNPDVEIGIGDEDFLKVGKREVTFQHILESGSVQVKGDPDLFMKMIEKFQLNKSK